MAFHQSIVNIQFQAIYLYLKHFCFSTKDFDPCLISH